MRLTLTKPPPARIARYQGLLTLLEVGITEVAIRAAIEGVVDPIERERHRIRFEMPFWLRDSPFIAWGQTAFGLTDAQTDDLFRLAVAL